MIVDSITGLVLAGGAGRRAGNRDKGTIPWQGEPLIAHVCERLQPQVRNIVISCNRNRDFYQRYAPTTRADLRSDYQGPLAGLEAAQPHIDTEFLLVVPCDMPQLPAELARVLIRPLLESEKVSISFARAQGDNHYLCALLRTSCLSSLTAYLDKGGRAVRHWYAECGALAVDVDACPEAFLNLNQPE